MAWRTLAVLVAFAAGILAGAARAAHPWPLLLAAAAAAGVAWVLSRRAGREALARRVRPGAWITGAFRLATVGLLAGALGVHAGARAMARALTPPLLDDVRREQGGAPGTAVMIEGTVRGDAAPTDYGVGIVVDVTSVRSAGRWHPSAGGVRVSVGGSLATARAGEWRDGRTVRLPVTLRDPQPYRNPGGPDQRRALALRGLAFLGSTKSGALVETVRPGTALRETAAAVRGYVRDAVRRTMLPTGPPSGSTASSDAALRAGIVTAILIGDRAGIPPDVADRLQRAGTFHVIAISGGNIAILTGVLLACLHVLRLPPRAGPAVTLVAIGAYGFVASGSASVTRATVVAVIYLAGRVIDVRARGVAVLWAALMVLLAWSPLALFDAGFLLTCGATIGILSTGGSRATRGGESNASGRPMGTRRGITRAIHGAWEWAWSITVATLAAEIVLWPLAASLFSRVTVAGLLLNPIAIPLMAAAQVAGLLLVGAATAWPWAAHLAGQGAGLAVGGLLWTARAVDVWPALSWRVPPPPLVAIAAHYAAWVGWRACRWTGRRGWSWACAAAGCGCAWWIACAPAWLPTGPLMLPPAPAVRAGGRDAGGAPLRIVFLDVGQGDATLIRFPSGRAWLVDAGGIPGATTFDVGARVVAPALWAMGVRALDVVALTHADPDHVGGAASVVADFAPREIWEGIPVRGDPLVARIAAAAEALRVTWRQRRRGESVQVESVRVRVLHPPAPEWERRRARNDDSLTIEVRYEGVRVLLTADIGVAVETDLLDRVGEASSEGAWFTVLKVPHHGSAGSSSAAWLEAVRPSVAVASAGVGNRFGHPAPAVVARYEQMGIPLLRTDRDGAVALVVDGDGAAVHSWNGVAWSLVRQASRPRPDVPVR